MEKTITIRGAKVTIEPAKMITIRGEVTRLHEEGERITVKARVVSDRDQKTLNMIEKTRQEVIARCGIDVRQLSDADRWTAGLPHDARRALNLELGRRKAVAAGQIPADA